MNNTFDIKRFGKLFKKHTVENYKGYLMSAVVLIGLLSVAYGFLLYQQDNMITLTERIVIFIGSFILAGSIFTSTIFTNYASKERAIAFITLPASQFEKYLIGWVYSLLIFTLLFLGCFYLTDFLFLSASDMPDEQKKAINLFSDPRKPYYAFYAYAFFNAVCLYGAIAFKKLHFIKTGFLFFGVLFLMIFINGKIMSSLIPEDVMKAIPFAGFSFRDKAQHYFNVLLDDDLSFNYVKFMVISVSACLWIGSFFQIKEKQV